MRSLPFGAVLSLPLRVPGLTPVFDALYRLVPPRRFAISGGPRHGRLRAPPPAGGAASEATVPEVPPSVRLRRLFSGALREVAAVALLAAVLAQAARENPFPSAMQKIPQPRAFAAITGWTRAVSRYDVFAPEPPKEDGVLVVDAQTRSGSPRSTP